MKKKFKVIVALVIIVAIAVGAYFIFGRNKSNLEVYSAINSLYLEKAEGDDDVLLAQKIDDTVADMLNVIKNKNFNIPEVKQFLSVYNETITMYSDVKELILTYGTLNTEENNNEYINKVVDSANSLKQIYSKSYEYLEDTYFTVTNPQNHNKEFIVNFYNLFKDAIMEVNAMYYNASIVYAHGTKIVADSNGYDKLKVELYATLVNGYVNTYLADSTKTAEMDAYKLKINDFTLEKSNSVNLYLDNKAVYDQLLSNTKSLNLTKLAEKVSTNNVDAFISEIDNQQEKSLYENYKTYVIEG